MREGWGVVMRGFGGGFGGWRWVERAGFCGIGFVGWNGLWTRGVGGNDFVYGDMEGDKR